MSRHCNNCISDIEFNSAVSALPPILQKNIDRNLCVCNEVSKRKIIETILEGAETVIEIRAKTYATAGNGCCKREVERLLEELQNIRKNT